MKTVMQDGAKLAECEIYQIRYHSRAIRRPACGLRWRARGIIFTAVNVASMSCSDSTYDASLTALLVQALREKISVKVRW